MPVEVKFKGKITYIDEKIAKIAFDYLIEREKTVFFVPPEYRNDPGFYNVELQGKKLKIDYDGDCGYGEFYPSKAAVAEVLGLAYSGKVIFGTVEYEDEGYVEYEISWSYKLKIELKEKGLIEMGE